MLRGPKSNLTKPLLLLPLAALIAILPLILHGTSCGQDQVFHIESWLDAASQLRHFHYPHWAVTAAWNAGEPRFLFYPPLSWLLGALLTMILPIAACPTVFIFLSLLASGLTFHHFARHFVSPNAALLASAFYLANPYMLFCAFERSAYAELLAAAWIPLLLLAVLRPRPTIRTIAIPLALLWLTNAPAAVIGSYALALLATLRITFTLIRSRSQSSQPGSFHPTIPSSRPERSAVERSPHFAPPPTHTPQPLPLALTYLLATALGLALPAYYLIPAAYERRYVQVAMAIIPNMRFQDNFLFTHTVDAAHNAVNLTASLLALTLVLLTAVALTVLCLRWRSHTPETRNLLRSFLPTVALITLLLTPLSTPLWQHLPELAFLQFPWRLLTLLTPILAFSFALLLNKIPSIRYPVILSEGRSPQSKDPDTLLPAHTLSNLSAIVTATLLLPLALTLLCFHLYAQACDPHDTPSNIASLLDTGHGLGPTDEYTPTAADNDLLRSDNPAFWLLPANADPNTPAPHTTPTAAQLNPNLDTDDTPIPVAQTLSTPTPHHFVIRTDKPATLVLNLRNYPNLDITHSDPNSMELQRPPHLLRDDGLIAVPLFYASTYSFDITWHRTPDQTLGLLLSALALLALALLPRRLA